MGYRPHTAIANQLIDLGTAIPECIWDFIYRGGPDFPFDVNGWWCEHPDWIEDYGEIYTLPFVKGNVDIQKDRDRVVGNYKVLYVNTSQARNVGGENHVFIAYDKASLDLFCKDFNLNKKLIRQDQVITWWC